MFEKKIALTKVAKYLNELDGEFDIAMAQEKNGALKIGKEKFEFNLMPGYTDSRIFVDSVVTLITDIDHIAYAHKEAYTIFIIFKMFTNIDIEYCDTNLDELIKLPYNSDVLTIMKYLRYHDEYDAIDMLVRELDMRLTQQQARLNNMKNFDVILEAFGGLLQEVMTTLKTEDLNALVDVLHKLNAVEQKDIINKVLELGENRAK